MDVAWQDGAGSFLDWSGGDLSGSLASFASGDGSVLWSSSADTLLFSGDSVLWESSGDSPSDSRLAALTLDDAGETDTVTRLVSSSIADGTPRLAGGLLWADAASDTSSSLTSNGGVGLGALDLSAGSGASQWQQFASDFASQSAIGLSEVPQLLWTGASSQPLVTDGRQPVLLAPGDSLALPTLGSLPPTQLVWAEPSQAPALTGGPILADAGPTMFARTLGVPPQSPGGLLPRLGGTP